MFPTAQTSRLTKLHFVLCDLCTEVVCPMADSSGDDGPAPSVFDGDVSPRALPHTSSREFKPTSLVSCSEQLAIVPFIKRQANQPSQAVAIPQPPTMAPRSRTLTVQDEPHDSTPTAVTEDLPSPSPNPRRSQRQKEKANKDDDGSGDNVQVELLVPRCFSFTQCHLSPCVQR